MLRDITIKTEKRLHDIQQCHEKVDKAIRYLNKVDKMQNILIQTNAFGTVILVLDYKPFLSPQKKKKNRCNPFLRLLVNKVHSSLGTNNTI